MKPTLAWYLLIAALASYPVSAGGADQPPKRAKYSRRTLFACGASGFHDYYRFG